MPSFLSRMHRVQQSHSTAASIFSSSVANSRSRVFPQVDLCTSKSLNEFVLEHVIYTPRGVYEYKFSVTGRPGGLMVTLEHY